MGLLFDIFVARGAGAAAAAGAATAGAAAGAAAADGAGATDVDGFAAAVFVLDMPSSLLSGKEEPSQRRRLCRLRGRSSCDRFHLPGERRCTSTWKLTSTTE